MSTIRWYNEFQAVDRAGEKPKQDSKRLRRNIISFSFRFFRHLLLPSFFGCSSAAQEEPFGNTLLTQLFASSDLTGLQTSIKSLETNQF